MVFGIKRYFDDPSSDGAESLQFLVSEGRNGGFQPWGSV